MSYLPFATEVLPLLDLCELPDPEVSVETPTPAPFVPEAPNPDMLPALPPEPSIPVTGVQNGLSLIEMVTVVTY